MSLHRANGSSVIKEAFTLKELPSFLFQVDDASLGVTKLERGKVKLFSLGTPCGALVE